MIKYNDLQNFEYIFFDIFDTLLFRKVNPEYVKKIWSNHIIKFFDLNIDMIELYEFRNKVETNLCDDNYKNGFDQEFVYHDLIKCIYKYFIVDKYEINFDEFYNVCVDVEVEIEKNVQYLDTDIISIIKKLKKDNKKIYCISDMYLSKSMLKKIFEYHNIWNLFDDIYVSCEHLVNKKSGRLYDLVLNELNIKSDKCVMIGDNVFSDFEIPINLGFKAFHLKRDNIYNFYSDYIINNSFEKIDKDFYEIASSSTDSFEHVIFSLYTFTEKLYYNLLRTNKKEIVFLSREGEFLKKIFDIYVSKVYNKNIISKYMIVSRKSTYLPSLKPIKEEKFSSLLNQYSYISAYEFLKSLNFSEEEISDIQKSLDNNFNFNEKISDMVNSSIYKKIINNKNFVKIYEYKRKNQKNNFKKYVKQITSENDISVVDIGWNGSIQDNIQNILGNSYKINGYYLGLEKRDFVFDENKKGLIFSNVPNYSEFYKLYNVNRSIYEILLGASHGSANLYVEEDEIIKVELFSKDEERKIYDDIISKIQEKMLDYFSKLCDLFANGFYDNIKYIKLFNKIHFNMMFRPNLNQIKFFNNIYHYENFGLFEFTTFNKTKKINFKFKLIEYFKFISKYNVYFNDSFWPMLKLYNYNMKIAIIMYRNLKRFQFLKTNVM